MQSLAHFLNANTSLTREVWMNRGVHWSFSYGPGNTPSLHFALGPINFSLSGTTSETLLAGVAYIVSEREHRATIARRCIDRAADIDVGPQEHHACPI